MRQIEEKRYLLVVNSNIIFTSSPGIFYYSTKKCIYQTKEWPGRKRLAQDIKRNGSVEEERDL